VKFGFLVTSQVVTILIECVFNVPASSRSRFAADSKSPPPFFILFLHCTMRDPKKRRNTVLYLIASTLAQACFLKLKQNATSASHKSSFRMPNIARKRAKIVNIQRNLGRCFFRQSYRMSNEKFDRLVQILKPHLPEKKCVGPNGNILIEIELSIALWYFAGGSPLDFIGSHGLSFTSIWNCIWQIVMAINKSDELQIEFP
jgi:hypothetical protein